MKIVYAIGRIGLTGGVKVFLQHVRLLKSLGHDVILITRFVDGNVHFDAEPNVVFSFDERSVPDAEAIVATRPKDVKQLWKIAERRHIPLFHLVQLFEPEHILERMNGTLVPIRYTSGDILTKLNYFKKRFITWKWKLKRIDSIYKLPTIKIAISPHIVRAIKMRYGLPCEYVPNGVDRSVFYQKQSELDYSGRLRILSVGNYYADFKCIPDVLSAIRILKRDGIDCSFTRISPSYISLDEINSGLVDNFLSGLSETEMARQYRDHHIMIFVSTEAEGFGLPPIEAMSVGTPVILTKVSSFLSFDTPNDYAYFVDVHRPEEIAEGVVRIRTDGPLRKSIVTRGLQVANKYSLEVVGAKLVRVLKMHLISDSSSGFDSRGEIGESQG